MSMESVEQRRKAIEAALETVVSGVEDAELNEELESVVLSEGKRVRPTLTLLVWEAVTGRPADQGSVERTEEMAKTALDFAVGIELVHNASLVVDDIIDRSPLRRGDASAWAEHGHGPALVASNGLLGEAFRQFESHPAAMEAVANAMVELGAGEATELTDKPDTEAEYVELARQKTGALFRAAAELGAIAGEADAETIEAVGDYAERVGIAFQIKDDVLDETADESELGKPTGLDAEMDRPSILQVTDRSPEAVTALAREQAEAAVGSLERATLPEQSIESQLETLAEFVVEREQ